MLLVAMAAAGLTVSQMAMVSPSFTMPILPTGAAVALLPGERTKYSLRNERSRDFFVDAFAKQEFIGQLLRNHGGQMLVQSVPVIKVVRLHLGAEPYAELTCVGRGQLRLPLQPDGGRGHHSRGTIQPLTDISLSTVSYQHDIRRLYHSCHRLAARVKQGPHTSRSTARLVRLFDQSLEELLRTRRQNLFTAACDGMLGAEEADVFDRRLARVLDGVCTPWTDSDVAGVVAADERDGRSRDGGGHNPPMSALWHAHAGEVQIQLLSFAVASVLSPDRRLDCLATCNTQLRMAHDVQQLHAFERRLSAELSLQAWAGAAVDRDSSVGDGA